MAAISLTCISAFFIILLYRGSEGEKQDLLKYDKVINKFAWNLYKEARHPSQSTILSPIGIQLLLAMLLQGANGTTAAEIESVFQHEADDKKILDVYKYFLENKNNKPKKKLFDAAATVVVDESLPLLENFDQNLNDYFNTEIMRCNFKVNPNDCRTNITAWMNDIIGGEIQMHLPRGLIDSTTKMVMVSITSFKGIWKTKFNKKYTREQPFYINSNDTVKVKMMELTASSFRYHWSSDFGVNIVELPYTDEEFRMIIILPDKHNLAEVEAKLTFENITELINSVREIEIDIFLPRFKVKTPIKLVDVLKKMGMHTAFSPYADFSKMTNSSISVSNIIQKASIVVNERGTQAVASSGIELIAKSIPYSMVCNSPFLYIILKRDTILFIGNFLKP